MADFTLVGCAVAESIGYKREEFLRAYYANIDRQHEEVIESDSTASYLMCFMAEREAWSGKATRLFAELEALAKADELDPRRLGLPKAPNALTRKLNVLRTSLAEMGIQVESHKGDVTIRKGQGNTSRIDISPTGAEVGDSVDIPLTFDDSEGENSQEPTEDE